MSKSGSMNIIVNRREFLHHITHLDGQSSGAGKGFQVRTDTWMRYDENSPIHEDSYLFYFIF